MPHAGLPRCLRRKKSSLMVVKFAYEVMVLKPEVTSLIARGTKIVRNIAIKLWEAVT